MIFAVAVVVLNVLFVAVLVMGNISKSTATVRTSFCCFVVGVSFLYGINIMGENFLISLDTNVATVLTSVLLGIPGIVLMFIIKFFENIF